MKDSKYIQQLSSDKKLWPCPTCGKVIKDHTNKGDLGRCYYIALLKHLLGEGPGWNIVDGELKP